MALDVVEGTVEGEADPTGEHPTVNLVFSVMHDAAAGTFTFVKHTGSRMDLAELVYDVDAMAMRADSGAGRD